ncbi:dUTP diphosphatase domain protein, partial [Ancylostoma caninum]
DVLENPALQRHSREPIHARNLKWARSCRRTLPFLRPLHQDSLFTDGLVMFVERLLIRKALSSHFLRSSLYASRMTTLSARDLNVHDAAGDVECKKPRMDEQRLTVRFVKLNADAQEPVYGSAAAAGADLFSAEDCVVPAHGKMCVSTGLQVELPYGYYGRVAPRSGLAAKNFIDVGAGVVDSDYRGELKVLLFNFGSTDFERLLIRKALSSHFLRSSLYASRMTTLSARDLNVHDAAGDVECKKPRMDEQRLTVRFVKLNADAQEPVYGSAAAAGADLFSAEDCVVPAHGKSPFFAIYHSTLQAGLLLFGFCTAEF